MDAKLLDILVCPLCKGPLLYQQDGAGADLQALPTGLSDQGRYPGDARGRGAQAPARGRGLKARGIRKLHSPRYDGCSGPPLATTMTASPLTWTS